MAVSHRTGVDIYCTSQSQINNKQNTINSSKGTVKTFTLLQKKPTVFQINAVLLKILSSTTVLSIDKSIHGQPIRNK